jgi:integrase
MPLTDAQAKAAKPLPDRDYKLADGKGMYLLIARTGGKYWRCKYRFGGKEKTLSFGVYPEVGLRDAREALTTARALLRTGIDPQDAKAQAQQARTKIRVAVSLTFTAVYEQWYAKQAYAPATAKKAQWLYDKYLHLLGARPVAQITSGEVITLIECIEALGKLETAHRAKQRISDVLRFAKQKGYIEVNPAADLAGILKPVREVHHAAITDPAGIGALLRAIDGYDGQPTTRAALQLAPHLFVRPYELRAAEWCEFDFEERMWRVPAIRMKGRDLHLVPLSRQVIAILEGLRPLTGHGQYVFPALGNAARPLSNATLNSALRRLGYSHEEQVAHGFRTVASTRLNELGFNSDWIEMQLAHLPVGQIRATYNRAQYLADRVKMMQQWSDHLDQLKRKKAQLWAVG